MRAFCQGLARRRARGAQTQRVGQQRRDQRVGAGVETGNVRIGRIGIGAGHAQRRVDEAGCPIVEQLGIDADIAAIELLGDVELDLAAAHRVHAGFARTFTFAIETADMEAPAIAKTRAIIEIGAIAFEIDADRAHHRSAFDLSGLGDQVDHATRSIRGEGRCRSATDRFHLRDIEVGADEDVRREGEQVTEFEDRQAVFLQLDVLGAIVDERQAAHGIAVSALARRSVDADAGNVAEQFGQRSRRDGDDVVFLDRAGRGRAVQTVTATCHAGSDHIAFIDGAARLPGRHRLVFLGQGRRGHGDHRDGDGGRASRTVIFEEIHELPLL